MRPNLVPILLGGALLLSSSLSFAQTAAPQIQLKDVIEHSIDLHGLKLTVFKLSASSIKLTLTNTTSSSIAVAPEDIALVDHLDSQAFIARINSGTGVCPFPKFRLAPGATVLLYGDLSALMEFPIKIYCFDTLCAVISK